MSELKQYGGEILKIGAYLAVAIFAGGKAKKHIKVAEKLATNINLGDLIRGLF